MPNAKTPSEKMRAILASARKRHQGREDVAGSLDNIQDMMRPGAARVRNAQIESGDRSDFVFVLYERLPEIMAELIAARPNAHNNKDGNDNAKSLREFEASLADEFFNLVEGILNMGLTSRSRSYDPQLIRDRLDPILEIMELLKVVKQKKG